MGFRVQGLVLSVEGFPAAAWLDVMVKVALPVWLVGSLIVRLGFRWPCWWFGFQVAFLGVWCFGFRVQGLVLRVEGLGLGLEFRGSGLGLMEAGLGLGAPGSGLGVGV